MLAFKNKPIPGTVSKMKGCHPCAPESSLFLLLLLTFTSLDSIWGLNFRRTHVTEDQGAIHSRRQWRPLEDCNTSPDFYIALDKGSRVKTDWKFFYKFAVDIVARFRKNPILRISFITFACKGNIINPITSNRVKIQKALDRLKYTIPAGYMLPFNALYKANIQIERLKRLGLHTYSVIILVINNEMKPPEFKVTLKEAQYSRKLSAVIIAIGVGYSKRDQLTQITGKPENTFSSQYTESHLQEAVNMIHQRFCPRLTGVQNRTLCIRGGNTMIVEGYGFDIAGNVENIICRYVYSGKIFKHEKAFTYSSNMIICRTPPSEEVGKAVFIEISLNKGHSYMDGNIFMFTRSCGRTLSTTLKTKPTRGKPTTTTRKTTRPTTMTTTTMMTATTTITTAELGTATAIATPMTTTTPNVLPTHVAIRLTITPIPHITPETPMISNFIFVPIGLALLFAVLLFGCLRQLCCPPPVKEPPVPLLPPVTKKEHPPQPPPPPPPTVNVCPTVIVCCCACRGICDSTGLEGNMALCCLDAPSCPPLPLTWYPSRTQGSCSSFSFFPAICGQAPCSSQIQLAPSQECVPVTYCPQCHHFPGQCSWPPSRVLSLISHSDWRARRPLLSLPPM